MKYKGKLSYNESFIAIFSSVTVDIVRSHIVNAIINGSCGDIQQVIVWSL